MLPSNVGVFLSNEPLAVISATASLHMANNNLFQTWAKELSDGHYAVAVLSTRTDGTPHEHTFTLTQVGIDKASSYSLYDLYEKKSVGKFLPKDDILVYVVPNGIRMFRVLPVSFEVVEGDLINLEF